MYKLELSKEGYTIVNASTGQKIATVPDIVDAIASVRACNRTARQVVSVG